ncbi:MAG: outer membrane protein assembly factor BamA [Candidatus Latescibacterota bacterium]
MHAKLGILLLCTCLSLGIGLSEAQMAPTRIGQLEVRGNIRSDASLVLATSGLSVGNDLTLENTQHAIRRLYALGVYRDIRVVVVGQGPEGLHIAIAVEEFPTVSKIAFEGNEKIKTKELKDALHFAEGQVVGEKGVKNAQVRIKRLYEKEGYLLARVSSEFSKPDETGKVALVLLIHEGGKVKVKHISVVGNETFEGTKIRKLMETKENRWWRRGDFKEDAFREDLKKITAFYRAHGYRDATVARDSLYYDDSKRHLFIDITIQEGPPYWFGTFTWEGNALFSDAQIAEKITISEGDTYDQEKFDRMYAGLTFAYQEQGYLGAKIVPETVEEGQTVDFHFVIEEGQPSKIRKVEIAGNTKTKEKVIRRELKLIPGDVFRRSALERSARNIYLLNYFGNVEPDVEPLPNGDVDVTFRVEEKPTGQAMMGAGYSEQYKLTGSLGFGIPNLFGNGQALDFNWDFGSRQERFQLSFSEPWLLDTPTSGSFSVYQLTYKYSDYDELRSGGSVSVGRKLTWPDDYSTIRLLYRLEEVEYRDFRAGYSDPYGLQKRKWPQTTSSISATYFRDSRDRPEFPSRGSVYSYRTEFASKFLGSDEGFHKHEVNSEFYYPMFWKTALLVKNRMGYVNGFGSDHDVLPRERFRPGGTSFDGVIRGYNDMSVGPSEGGRAMFIAGLECQFPIVEQQIYGLIFADAGNSWLWFSETDPFDLKRSLGFGARVMAPMIGLIGFDFAYGFDHLRNGKRAGEWHTHFQFGKSF